MTGREVLVALPAPSSALVPMLWLSLSLGVFQVLEPVAMSFVASALLGLVALRRKRA